MAKTIDKFVAYGPNGVDWKARGNATLSTGTRQIWGSQIRTEEDRIHTTTHPDAPKDFADHVIRQTIQRIQEDVFEAVPVVGDSVVKQFWDSNDNIHNFPPLIPPFDNTWVECPVKPNPSVPNTESEVLNRALRNAARNKYRMGMLYKAEKVIDGRFEGLRYHENGLTMPHGWSYQGTRRDTPTYTDATYWCSAMLFYDLGKRSNQVFGPIAYVGFPLDERGYFMPDESTRICNSMYYDDGGTPQFVEAVTTQQGAKVLCFQTDNEALPTTYGVEGSTKAVFTAISGLLYCIGLMNCRNIDTVTVMPPKGLSKKFKKRSGRPLLKYRVITVEQSDSGRVKTIRGRKHQDDRMIAESEMPQHIVRGHFKTYSRDRPLFGKYSGTWWWHHATKGTKEHGEIVHEYEVGASDDRVA